jgi:hypothetical protein
MAWGGTIAGYSELASLTGLLSNASKVGKKIYPQGQLTPEKYYDIKINTTGATSKLLNALDINYGIKYRVDDIFGANYLEYRNTVINSNRTGSALKIDTIKPIIDENKIVKEFPMESQGHGFNKLVDNYADYNAEKFSIPTIGKDGVIVRNSELYQLEGSLNGRNGVFEWIIDQGNRHIEGLFLVEV